MNEESQVKWGGLISKLKVKTQRQHVLMSPGKLGYQGQLGPGSIGGARGLKED